MRGEGTVLDASALLAYIQREVGYELVDEAIRAGTTVSTVNLAEVYGHLEARGVDAEGLVTRLKVAGLGVEPFHESDAIATGGLLGSTRALGLSLADRACVALAQRLDRPILTADRSWRADAVGVEIQMIR